jgi:hypothetical protein
MNAGLRRISGRWCFSVCRSVLEVLCRGCGRWPIRGLGVAGGFALAADANQTIKVEKTVTIHKRAGMNCTVLARDFANLPSVYGSTQTRYGNRMVKPATGLPAPIGTV